MMAREWRVSVVMMIFLAAIFTIGESTANTCRFGDANSNKGPKGQWTLSPIGERGSCSCTKSIYDNDGSATIVPGDGISDEHWKMFRCPKVEEQHDVISSTGTTKMPTSSTTTSTNKSSVHTDTNTTLESSTYKEITIATSAEITEPTVVPTDTTSIEETSGWITSEEQYSGNYTECYTETDGADYRGTVSTTENGLTCQMWTSSQTHDNHTSTQANYHDLGIGDHNYCRNPNGSAHTWCYTFDSDVPRDFCDIGDPQNSCSGGDTSTRRPRCFASSSIVSVRHESKDGTIEIQQKRLDQLKVGEHVESFNVETNSVDFSEVYFITHAHDQSKDHRLLKLLLGFHEDNEISIRLHQKHLLYACSVEGSACLLPPKVPITAESVNVGDFVWVKNANGEFHPTPVLDIGKCSDGIRHPMTLNHVIVVDDVLASVHMYNEELYRLVTSPLRFLYGVNPSITNSTLVKQMVEMWDLVEENCL